MLLFFVIFFSLVLVVRRGNVYNIYIHIVRLFPFWRTDLPMEIITIACEKFTKCSPLLLMRLFVFFFLTETTTAAATTTQVTVNLHTAFYPPGLLLLLPFCHSVGVEGCCVKNSTCVCIYVPSFHFHFISCTMFASTFCSMVAKTTISHTHDDDQFNLKQTHQFSI